MVILVDYCQQKIHPRTVDLQELAIQVIGQSDGSFDENDYILFFGQSPNQWTLNSSGLFSRQQHYYDDNTYYFITADIGEGKRVESFQSLSSSDTIIKPSMIIKFTKKKKSILSNLVKIGMEMFSIWLIVNHSISAFLI